MRTQLSNAKGFTLVEIMIVVAIIAILASIAIPNLVNARQTAQENAALGTLRSIVSAEEAYYVGEGSVYTDLAGLNSGGYMSADYGTGTFGNYTFTHSKTTTQDYTIKATNTAGMDSFTAAQGGQMQRCTSQDATSGCSAL